MARRKPKSRRSASPARSRRTPVKTGTAAQEPKSQPVPSHDDLTEAYGYVRRDLLRIAILAVIMFAIIFAAPYFLI